MRVATGLQFSNALGLGEYMIGLRKVCSKYWDFGRFCPGMGDYISVISDTFYLSAALENVGMRNTSFGIGTKKDPK